MKKIDKNAFKTAALITAVVLVVFEALTVLVQVVDPEGGLLRVNYRSPLQHVIIAAVSLVFGYRVYVREHKKNM